MEINETKIDFAVAQNRVKDLRNFYISLVAFLIVNLIIMLRHYSKYGVLEISFAHSLIMGIWLIFLVIRDVKFYIFNPNWERQKMEEFFKKLN